MVRKHEDKQFVMSESPNKWELPIRKAPTHVKATVSAELEVMRFAGTVVETFMGALGTTFGGFFRKFEPPTAPNEEAEL